MNAKRLLTLLAAVALAAAAAGCDSGTNTNTNANANGNRAANTNTNANANANTAANTNTNTAGGAYNRNYNSREEYQRDDANYRAEARNAGSTIGQGLEDGWIHLKTRGALAAADDLRDSTINVDVDNGVVTLRGTVASAAQKTKAATVAKGIEGVKSVNNRLDVGPAASGNANGSGPNTNKK
jgi:hyperosmotically inducible protein